MSGVKELLGSRPVIFLKTKAIGIDRGWDPADVEQLLNNAGIETKVIELKTVADLSDTVGLFRSAIFWPACYTLFDDPRQSLVVNLLEEMGASYVGASSKSLAFSNKLIFKKHAVRIPGVRTPDYREVAGGDGAVFPNDIPFPAMLKTEYSCNSEGVRRLNTIDDFHLMNRELRKSFGQRHYVEKWERAQEYTVAYLPATPIRKSLIAPIGMEILSGATYIDVETKASSPLVRVFKLDDGETAELEQMTSSLVEGLSIDGHCRVDFIRNSDDCLFVIEVNFQPFMSISEPDRSYFPNALMLARELGFYGQVYRILEHAVCRSGG